MSSETPKRSLTVLDVGHGSAAVLQDEGGVVVFDTGRGAHLDRYLKSLGVHEVAAMFLSRADSDHIGGAVTLLLNAGLRVGCVFLNPDPTKETDVFVQLRYALSEAQTRSGTMTEPSLTTNTRCPRKGASIEVLYPPVSAALGGAGGRDLAGNRLTSNSLSAAIRVTGASNASVLLGGDIEFGCLDEWKRQGVAPSAWALVFPHHGGLPGDCDEAEAALFAHELTRMVTPAVVVFSIHRSKFGLPRDEVLRAILGASENVRFVCTQLPNRFHANVAVKPEWSIHRHPSGQGFREGMVELEFVEGGFEIRFH